MGARERTVGQVSLASFPAADLAHIHEYAPMSVFRGKHIFLTGATGWFGQWLQFALTESRISTLAERDFPDTIEPIDFLIHAAPSQTRETLDFAHRHGCKRALFISSGAVYARDDAYANAKRRDEAICKAHALKPVIARCFTFVGPGQKLGAHWAVGNFLADAIAGRTIKVKGDGSAIRSYMHMADLVVALLAILADGEGAHDVGSPEPVSIEDLALKIGDMAGVAAVIEGKPSEPDYYVPNNTAPVRIGLDDALRRTYAWLKQ